MSITRSYNKHTDTYYAYDTTYEWSEKLQKKIQHKKCIGKYDPETGKVIPTGKRGRPVKQTAMQKPPENAASVTEPQRQKAAEALSEAEALYSKVEAIDALMSRTMEELAGLRRAVGALVKQLRADGEEVIR